MSAENKAVVRRWVEAFNRGELDAACRFLANDFVYTGPSGIMRGPQGWKELATMYRSAFSDTVLVIEAQIAEGDQVVTLFTARATHDGNFAGIEPTGRKVAVPSLQIDRIVDGLVVESRQFFDQLAMFQALGATPPIPAAV